MASQGSNKRESPDPLSTPDEALNDLLAHAGHLVQLVDTYPNVSPLRPYAEAIVTGLGTGVPGGGDVQT